MCEDEIVALCALNRIFGYHPQLGGEIIASAGSAAAVFSNPPLIPEHPELSEQIVPSSLDWAVRELAAVRDKGFRFIPIGDDDYPEPLLDCPDPPLGIYLNACSSPAEIFSLRPMIGIVGTRDVSPYGTLSCRKIVRALSLSGVQPCIVSGLAFGTDGVAHAAALDSGLTTIGIMATGIEKIYPWQHESLASRIVGTPGCALVTDYPMGTSPVALNFVRRNRIIAGLCRAVIVIESKKKGGSLLTAKYAVDYSRDVFCVPGRLDDVRSAGCNSLIAAHMAEIVESPEALVDRLGLLPRPGSRVGLRRAFSSALAGRYGDGSTAVLVGLAVFDNPGAGFEEIAGTIGRPYSAVLEAAGILEAEGFIVTDILQRCTVSSRFA